MVRDYVARLYLPAARVGRQALDGRLRRGRASWPPGSSGSRGLAEVRVDHVESGGVGDSPQLGDDAAACGPSSSLGDSRPDDVDVQVVHGRVDRRRPDRPTRAATSLAVAETYEGGRYRFEGEVAARPHRPVRLHRAGRCPHHPLLASPAELGLAAYPPTSRRRDPESTDGARGQTPAGPRLARRARQERSRARLGAYAVSPRRAGAGRCAARGGARPGRRSRSVRGIGSCGVEHDLVRRRPRRPPAA